MELFCACCVCVCLCVAPLALTCLVHLCVQTKIIQHSAWECIHALCLEYESAKLYLVNESGGGGGTVSAAVIGKKT